ncbi:MAG TPA: PHB depolymerase family esterase [Polyangiaceae bacterium]|nr:PHB depolymerase family esterase [Polyangiaceae bacterium]
MRQANEVCHEPPNPLSAEGARRERVAEPLARRRAPPERSRWIFVVALSFGLLACGSDSGGAASSAAGSGGSSTTPGGSSSSAGMGTSNGGSTNTSLAGSAGALSAGGSIVSGGSTSGGTSAGGTSAGGTSSGGASVGGSSSGGSSAGSAGGGSVGACPMPVLKAGNSDKTLSFGGSNRSYTLHVPAAYDGSKPVPLVLDFHGLGGSGKSESTSSPYPAQTDADGVIMAFPTGLAGPSGNAWNVGPCCVKNTDDVAFAKALVTEIEKTACIDTKRVYAVGFSMGGGMSHYLACHAADVFAAVAPAAFDLLQENVNDCKPPRPISEISFRSTGDQVVNYTGGASMAVQGMPVTFLGAKGTFQKWAQINQCTGAASAEDANGCATYAGCPAGVEVTLCTKQGGSHEAGNAKVGWPALKKHTLP